MAFGFARRTRGEIFNYSRPSTITEYLPTGTVVYEPDESRLSYDRGWSRFLGMIFGDGGSAEIPPQVNPHWVDSSSPMTLLVIGQAPVGVTILRWGDIEIEGVNGHKLYIIERNDASTQTDTIQIFPNADEVPEDCHLMLVKYYNEKNIDFGTEGEAMNEANTFVNGAWN